MGLSGVTPLGEAKTKAPNSGYSYHSHKDVPLAAARQAEVARDYLKRATATRRAPTGRWPPRSSSGSCHSL